MEVINFYEFLTEANKASIFDIFSVPRETNKMCADHGRFFPFQSNIVKKWQGIEFEENYSFPGEM